MPLNNVILARDGDSAAFEALVHEFTPSIFRVASTIAGHDLAPDIVQDTFVSAWRDLKHLRQPERFAAWLHRIGVNRSRSAVRSRRRVREVSIDELRDDFVSSDFRQGAEDRSLLERALPRLSADQRIVIGLHYAAGMTLSQVADVLQVPGGTVKSRLNAALTELRRQMPEDFE